MNAGRTGPYAHPRSLSTFSRMADYPFQKRLRYGPYYTVGELAVKTGVRNIMDYVTEVTEMRCSPCKNGGIQSVRPVRTLYH